MLSNPYIVGNPVTNQSFFGREDILRQIEELWSAPGQLPSIVLYGQRRMGKTSILRNLPDRFPHDQIIDFNMQRVSYVESTGELIYNLAEVIRFFRSLIQTYPWFVLVFAGLHTLQEMTQNYWNPLFSSITLIPVSFINPKAATKLITNPATDFSLDYDKEAIELIYTLTSGQPYLVQLICHNLVTYYNNQKFEENIDRPARFSTQDIEAIITAPEFYRDGNAYLTGVWVQSQETYGQDQIDTPHTYASNPQAD